MTGEWDGATSEFNGGVRKYWATDSSLWPYIGGGLALIKAALNKANWHIQLCSRF